SVTVAPKRPLSCALCASIISWASWIVSWSVMAHSSCARQSGCRSSRGHNSGLHRCWSSACYRGSSVAGRQRGRGLGSMITAVGRCLPAVLCNAKAVCAKRERSLSTGRPRMEHRHTRQGHVRERLGYSSTCLDAEEYDGRGQASHKGGVKVT